MYALSSTNNDGLLCKDGHETKVSAEYNEGERYEGLVVTFANLSEANEYIAKTKYLALTPITFNTNSI